MKSYEEIDISGDVGLRIWGKSLEDLFVNAASGMISFMTDRLSGATTDKRTINIKSDSLENLIVQWLNEVLFLFDTYGFVGKNFEIDIDGDRDRLPLELNAEIMGGLFDPRTSEKRLLIKAATYHELSINKTDSVWEAVVIFDI